MEIPIKSLEPMADWGHRLIPQHAECSYTVGKVT